MQRQIAVVGIGKFGYKIIETLSKKGVSVIALDGNHEAVERVKDLAVEAMQIDTLSKEALEASGVCDVDAVIVALGTDVESSILITAILHELGVKEIVARAKSPLHARILKQVGAGRIVFPEEDMAVRVANSVTQPNVLEYIELAGEFDLAEIIIRNGHEFVGESLSSLSIEKKYNVSLVIIRKSKVLKNGAGMKEDYAAKQIPYADYRIAVGDILVVVGDRKDLEKFENLF